MTARGGGPTPAELWNMGPRGVPTYPRVGIAERWHRNLPSLARERNPGLGSSNLFAVKSRLRRSNRHLYPYVGTGAPVPVAVPVHEYNYRSGTTGTWNHDHTQKQNHPAFTHYGYGRTRVRVLNLVQSGYRGKRDGTFEHTVCLLK